MLRIRVEPRVYKLVPFYREGLFCVLRLNVLGDQVPLAFLCLFNKLFEGVYEPCLNKLRLLFQMAL